MTPAPQWLHRPGLSEEHFHTSNYLGPRESERERKRRDEEVAREQGRPQTGRNSARFSECQPQVREELEVNVLVLRFDVDSGRCAEVKELIRQGQSSWANAELRVHP